MRFPRCVVVAVLVSSDRSLPKGRIWVTVRVRSKGEKESKVEGKVKGGGRVMVELGE